MSAAPKIPPKFFFISFLLNYVQFKDTRYFCFSGLTICKKISLTFARILTSCNFLLIEDGMRISVRYMVLKGILYSFEDHVADNYSSCFN